MWGSPSLPPRFEEQPALYTDEVSIEERDENGASNLACFRGLRDMLLGRLIVHARGAGK
jgi:hypothetical protein